MSEIRHRAQKDIPFFQIKIYCIFSAYRPLFLLECYVLFSFHSVFLFYIIYFFHRLFHYQRTGTWTSGRMLLDLKKT